MADLKNVNSYIAAGFARLEFHRLDSRGLPAGITGTVTPGAVGVAAARFLAVTTMNLNIPSATPVPVPGDNVLSGTFQFPSDQPRSFDIQGSADNYSNRQLFQNIKPRNIGNHRFAGRDVTPFSLNNIMLLGVSNASAKDSGVLGLGMYAGVFATRAQMSVRGRSGFVNRQAALFEGTVTLNPMDSYPWGETFQAAVEGYTQSFVEDWTHANPITVHRWHHSAGVLKYFLGEIPASTDLDDILVYTIDSNGIVTRKTSGVTIATADNSLTFGVEPTDLDIVSYYGYVPS